MRQGTRYRPSSSPRTTSPTRARAATISVRRRSGGRSLSRRSCFDTRTRRRVHCMRSTRSLLTLALVALLVGIASAQLRVAPVGERPGAISLELMLRKLGSTGTFMQTDAHPDDEDNALLAMLSHGQGMRA